MRRRDFIKRIAGAGAAWPLVARAQQAQQVARVGFLGVAPDNPLSAMGYAVFLAELRKLGFTEGQNLIVENRRIDEGPSKAFAGAAELIRSNVDVVVAFGPELALKAAVAASQTVPIVMIAINFDPMAGGYVRNITRPERNITGVVSRAPELAAKQLGLLVEAFPDVKPIAALWEQASADQFEAAQRAAQSLHIELRSHKVENLPFDFDAAFRAIAQDGSRMVLVLVRSDFWYSTRPYRRSGDTAPPSDHVYLQLLCRGRRADVLRCRSTPDISTRRFIGGQDSQRRKAV